MIFFHRLNDVGYTNYIDKLFRGKFALSNVLSHCKCRVLTPRKQGGLGEMKIPMLADRTGEIARAYGVYKEDSGVAFR